MKREQIVPSRCILVLGVARSGTSAVAGVLQRLGVRMLDESQANALATKSNPTGTYEDLEFLEIGRRLQFYGFKLMATEWRSYLRLIEERRRGHALWGVKEPRFMFVLEHFVKALSDCRAVVVRRNVEAIRQSTERWEADLWMPPSWMQSAALRRAALLFPALGSRLTVGYERLVADPEREIAKIAAFVFGGLERRPTPAQIASAVKFIDPALKHY